MRRSRSRSCSNNFPRICWSPCAARASHAFTSGSLGGEVFISPYLHASRSRGRVEVKKDLNLEFYMAVNSQGREIQAKQSHKRHWNPLFLLGYATREDRRLCARDFHASRPDPDSATVKNSGHRNASRSTKSLAKNHCVEDSTRRASKVRLGRAPAITTSPTKKAGSRPSLRNFVMIGRKIAVADDSAPRPFSTICH